MAKTKNTSNHEKHLKLARFMLLHEFPYYATPLWAMQVNYTDKLPSAMGVDRYWRLYYNDEILNFSVTELKTALIHEINHLIRKHADRAKFIAGVDNNQSTNICADFEINDDLKKEGLPFPKGYGVFPSDMNLPDFKTMEWYFNQLPKKQKNGQCKSQQGQGDQEQENESGSGTGDNDIMNGNCGSCADGQPRDYEKGEPKNGDGVSEVDGEIIRRRFAEDVQRHAKHQGNVPGWLERMVDEILNPKVRWEKELMASVKFAVNWYKGRYDYTFRRPNRRSHPDVVLPGMQTPLPNVHLLIDTSGSMSQDDLVRALAETKGVLKAISYEKLIVYSGDTDLGSVQKVNNIKNIKMTGGGGTDMGKLIEQIYKQGKPKPDIIICLTDGYTPWCSKIYNVKVIACIIGSTETTPDWIKPIYINED